MQWEEMGFCSGHSLPRIIIVQASLVKKAVPCMLGKRLYPRAAISE